MRTLAISNDILLRVDVVTLQSALLVCKSLAEGLLHNKQTPEVSDKLHEIVRVARDAVFIAEEAREDTELELLQTEAE